MGRRRSWGAEEDEEVLEGARRPNKQLTCLKSKRKEGWKDGWSIQKDLEQKETVGGGQGQAAQADCVATDRFNSTNTAL